MAAAEALVAEAAPRVGDEGMVGVSLLWKCSRERQVVRRGVSRSEPRLQRSGPRVMVGVRVGVRVGGRAAMTQRPSVQRLRGSGRVAMAVVVVVRAWRVLAAAVVYRVLVLGAGWVGCAAAAVVRRWRRRVRG